MHFYKTGHSSLPTKPPIWQMVRVLMLLLAHTGRAKRDALVLPFEDTHINMHVDMHADM